MSSKAMSERDSGQTLRLSFNDANDTLGVDGFLTGKVGRKITLTLSTTSVLDDTETYEFLEGATSLYQLRIIYTDGSRELMLSAERIA